MKEPVDHILRPGLPWRHGDGAITECGYNATSVSSIIDEFMANLARAKQAVERAKAELAGAVKQATPPAKVGLSVTASKHIVVRGAPGHRIVVHLPPNGQIDTAEVHDIDGVRVETRAGTTPSARIEP